jgi:nicotinamidase-related amidase
MSANMCVESHARDVLENGFDVVSVADAAYEAVITSHEFFAREVVSIKQIIKRAAEAN